MQRKVLLTGATGILGGWILCELLENNYAPVVIMRDATREDAQMRIRKILALVGSDYSHEAVTIYHGDVGKPHLGLELSDVAELRHEVEAFIHCAASVSFDPRQEQEIYATNVHGTLNVLKFIEDTSIPLYHVSTAYVAGTRQDVCFEDELDRNQEFKNAYERSKFDSEKIVQEAFKTGACRGAIFRPSIIVGASGGGRIAQFLNFYSFLKVMEAARTGRIPCNGNLRVVFPIDCTKNIVPVDWTAQAFMQIINKDGASNMVYHLTHPNPISHKKLIDWANSRLNPHGIQVEPVDALGKDSTIVERLGHVSLQHYRPYLSSEPIFDRTNTDRALNGSVPFPNTDHKFFDMLYEYAREHGWQDIYSSPLYHIEEPVVDLEARVGN